MTFPDAQGANISQGEENQFVSFNGEKLGVY